MAFKYVLFEKEDGRPTVCIFDGCVNHDDLARKMNMKVISAGKFHLDANNIACVSGSVSLDLKYNADQTQQDQTDIQKLYELI